MCGTRPRTVYCELETDAPQRPCRDFVGRRGSPNMFARMDGRVVERLPTPPAG